MGDTSKTVYITMIRDPVDIFVSAWDYYKQGETYKMTIGKIGGLLDGSPTGQASLRLLSRAICQLWAKCDKTQANSAYRT